MTTRPRTHALSLLALAGVLGCPPADDTPADTSSSTTAPIATGEPAPVTTGEPAPVTTTGDTGATTTEPPTSTGSSGSTGDPPMPSPCDACADDEVCVENIDTHTCGGFDDPTPACEPNPLACASSDPCSIACQDLCGTDTCSWGGVSECSSEPGALHCSSYQGRPEYACDPYTDEGCVPGKKCVPLSAVDDYWFTCVPVVDPAVAVGEACTPSSMGDECEAGSFCFNGACYAVCTGSPAAPDCADPANICLTANDGALPLCVPRCDPLAMACAPGDVCVPTPAGEPGFGCIDDGSGDGGQVLTPCNALNSCDPGLLCRLSEEVSAACVDDACCTPVCDLQAPPACPEQDQTCVAFYPPGEAPPGYESVGVCRIPG